MILISTGTQMLGLQFSQWLITYDDYGYLLPVVMQIETARYS